MKNQTMFGTYTSSRQTVIPEDQKRYNGIIAVKKNTHIFYYFTLDFK